MDNPSRVLPVKPARLVKDEDRIEALTWRIILGQERARDLSLHEIKAATGVHMTRLPVLLVRAGWRCVYIPYSAGLRLWRPPVIRDWPNYYEEADEA